MQKKIYIITLTIIGLFCLNIFSYAQDEGGFTQKDRVLILAPHPDDECIATGGIIQKALAAQAKVKVVCFTNGDQNELAFIVYEKRLIFKPREFIHMGEVRRKETVKAMEFLGLGQKDILFLGYPDFGTLEILLKYWGKVSPCKSIFSRTSRVPYKEALSYQAPYVGESILQDLKAVILDFKPTKIFVSHPADSNRDHQALYLFLRVALWDLEGKIKSPKIFPYLIHVVGWPVPRGYHPELGLKPPDALEKARWLASKLTDDEIIDKHKATSFYASQIKYNPLYLFTFSRRNELFGDLEPLKLKTQRKENLYWQALTLEPHKKKFFASENSAIAYMITDRNLFIKLDLGNRRKTFGALIFLLPYSKNKPFSLMPKLNLIISRAGLLVKEKKTSVFIKDIVLKYEDSYAVIKIPLSVLGSPDYILSVVKEKMGYLTLGLRSWRVLELK